MRREGRGRRKPSVPAVVLHHVRHFNDVLPLLVLLARLKSLLIFPAQGGFAALAENISYRVQPREQEALFSWPAPHVDHGVKQVGSAMAPLEGLGDELVVFGQVCAAVDAAVGAVAARQVAAEGLGGEAGGGRARVAAGHDGLEDDALAGGGRRRRAAPAQTVAGEAAEQVG